MILLTYPYAAPPVRLTERAEDGGIRLLLTLQRVNWQGPLLPVDAEEVETDSRVGFSEDGVKLLEMAKAVRGQLVFGAPRTMILGVLPDFGYVPPKAKPAKVHHVTVYDHGKLYASYDDTDLQSDHFNGASLGLHAMAKLLSTDGADEITLNPNGSGMASPTYDRRARQLAKEAGYELTEVVGTYASGRSWRRFIGKRLAAAGG